MRRDHPGGAHPLPPSWRGHQAGPVGAPLPTSAKCREAPRLPLHRQRRLDGVFEKLLRAYRQALLDAIAREPEGPARHLRAHINGLAAVVVARGHGVSFAARLLQHARYQRVWQDFIGEACANDPEDHGLAHVSRCTADPRRLAEVQHGRPPKRGAAAGRGVAGTISTQWDLLSLCALSVLAHGAAGSSRPPSSAPDEPYRTH
ncbi:hypothetical protein M4R22_02680 [Acidovorax sp. GBBC 3334]|uniref:hypothetical protein n=1 Tax=Acidovorax sp. GBBC 3334 TaxID=2940496 RepID=UPI002303BAA7|nr:hypothetical protein [Acidovorax sp. GBBC 3334]MDA8453661.1 hypothetical protein [Acidovorax sp. GBBC 3334]